MRSLVVGLGIGQLYKSVFEELNYTVDTVDANPEKNPTFTNLSQLQDQYDIAVICTPNFTHELIARGIAERCKIILIEKPGVQDSKAWQCLIEDHPNNRIMMVKNNQYRKEISDFQRLVSTSTNIYVIWNNKNRIPSPGSWFTTKELAFGGVSRDLLPHMLSYYTVLTEYNQGSKLSSISEQRHTLETVDSTDYGVVNKQGTFDVDDYAEIKFSNNTKTWQLSANWKNDISDDVYISFSNSYSAVKHKLGLCPESAYKKMIETAVKNLNNDSFWKIQYEQDLWIHQQIEQL
jgi:predicted dehydrogenase